MPEIRIYGSTKADILYVALHRPRALALEYRTCTRLSSLSQAAENFLNTDSILPVRISE